MSMTTMLLLLVSFALTTTGVHAFVPPATSTVATPSSPITVQPRARTDLARTARSSVVMMPASEPAVPYKAPGTDYHRYVGIYQRLYYDRVLLCGQFIDDRVANQIMSILWYLHNEDKNKPIYMYFNVPGALLRPALSVFDTMQAMSNEIETINIGLTTGMGAFLCAAGTKGRRFSLPNSRFLMQKTGFEEQVYGQASDIVLEVDSTMRENQRFLAELSRLTGRKPEQIKKDFGRDFYLSAEESVEYGMVDQVITPGRKDALSIMEGEVGFGKFVSGSDQRYQPQFAPQAWS